MGGSKELAGDSRPGFLSLPSTRIGKWSGGLLLASLALMLLNIFVLLPVSERRTGLESAQLAFNSVVFLCLVSSGVAGVVALVKRDRSWVVVLAVIVLLAAVAMVVSDLVIPG